MKNNNGLVTGVVMVLIFFLGFLLGNYFGSNDYTPTSITGGGTGQSTQTDETSGAPEGTSSAGVTEDTQIDASMLSEGQIKLLQTLGVDTDNITITPEMVACAEAKVGAARMEEIKNGATPSFGEGASLVACYK
jgi:hypothetical protein